jgi:hypothetical protein
MNILKNLVTLFIQLAPPGDVQATLHFAMDVRKVLGKLLQTDEWDHDLICGVVTKKTAPMIAQVLVSNGGAVLEEIEWIFEQQQAMSQQQ